MLVLAVGGEESRIHLEHTLELKGLDAKDLLHHDVGVLAAEDGGVLVDLAKPPLHAVQIGRRHKVHLVEEQPVGERDLLDGLVLGALGLRLV